METVGAEVGGGVLGGLDEGGYGIGRPGSVAEVVEEEVEDETLGLGCGKGRL